MTPVERHDFWRKFAGCPACGNLYITARAWQKHHAVFPDACNKGTRQWKKWIAVSAPTPVSTSEDGTDASTVQR